jgi:hypothetical protein
VGENPSAPDPFKDWAGEWRRYDLAKEFVAALGVVFVVVVLLAAMFGSPDSAPLTITKWSQADPTDFLQTAISELNGTSEIANYGPPYTNTPDAAQKVGPLSLQEIPGVTIPIDTANDFVLGPLQRQALQDPALQVALGDYAQAGSAQQDAWLKSYSEALSQARFGQGQASVIVPAGDYGPVEVMMDDYLRMAQSGGVDGALLATSQFYQTDYTEPLLFMSDGGYLSKLAAQEHLLGTQWGMMNETGSYPGQAWLWLYTAWYQVPPFRDSGNADALIWVLMGLLSLAFVLVPFIPGLRTLPKHLKIYRIIWRDYYRTVERAQVSSGSGPAAGTSS